MRGDSLRDLYAKTLALLGLGVLAGTGALVDYWPSGVAMPMVDAGLSQPEIASALPVPDRQPNFVVAGPARPRSVRPAVTVIQTAVADTPAPRFPDLALRSVADVPLDVALAEPPAAVPVQTFAFSVDYSLGEEVPLTEPTPWPVATLAMSAPVEMSADDEHGGLLTGMVKRTGSSILRGGRKTGASIMEAFRVVSGAVRRALPN